MIPDYVCNCQGKQCAECQLQTAYSYRRRSRSCRKPDENELNDVVKGRLHLQQQLRQQLQQQQHLQQQREIRESRPKRKHRFKKRSFSPGNLDDAKWV